MKFFDFFPFLSFSLHLSESYIWSCLVEVYARVFHSHCDRKNTAYSNVADMWEGSNLMGHERVFKEWRGEKSDVEFGVRLMLE